MKVLFLNLAISFSGILMFTLWRAKGHLKTFDLSTLMKDNGPYWIWSALICTLVSILVYVEPSLSKVIATFIGLDFSGNIASFLLLGAGVMSLAKPSKKS